MKIKTPLLNIFNFRKGFACNSSSSHSVVFFDKLPAQYLLNDDGFGWEQFVLTSPTSKEQYFAATLGSNLSALAPMRALPWNQPNDDEREALRLRLLQRAVDEGLITNGADGDRYVDHQSVLTLPATFTGDWFQQRFAREMKALLLRDDVVIIGGSDGGDPPDSGSFPGIRDAALPGIPREMYAPQSRDDGTHFVLFNQYDGTRIRCAVGPGAVTPLRGRTPELVDIKITDWCDKGCSYCYQGSTTKGVHADWRQLEVIIHALAKMEVFEIAFGGGEPTAHPRFMDLLRLAKSLHITPNFTTRNAAWLMQNHEELDKLIGAVAFSVDSVADVRLAREAFGVQTQMQEWTNHNDEVETMEAVTNANTVPSLWNKLQFQVVHGAMSTEELLLIEDAKVGRELLILGWKSNGRGASVKPVECDWTRLDRTYGLYVDTKLVQQHGPTLESLGANPLTMSAEEGSFSCYIDAVAGRMGPSSYCSKSLMHDVEPFASVGYLQEVWDHLTVQR